MNRQDIAHLTFKIVGLYCFIKAIPLLGQIPLVIQYLSNVAPQQSNLGWTLAAGTLGPGLLGAMGIWLWVKSRQLAERAFPDAEHEPPATKILALHALAFSLVGVIAILDSLPMVLGTLLWVSFNLSQFDIHTEWAFRSALEPLLKLAVGIALFFGSHRVVRIWSRLRYAGIREKLGICANCDYDLTGNTSGTCPECGTPVAGTSERTP